MGQEYFINSQELQDKVSNLLPSQGGAGAGFDLSASTQIIPVIDLTESAQGSNLRTDLQTALDGASTEFNISNASNTSIVTTTGFFRVYGTCTLGDSGGNQQRANFNIFDGASANVIWGYTLNVGASASCVSVLYDFVCFIKAGSSLRGTVSSAQSHLIGSTRQIASIDGTLTNPLGF